MFNRKAKSHLRTCTTTTTTTTTTTEECERGLSTNDIPVSFTFKIAISNVLQLIYNKVRKNSTLCQQINEIYKTLKDEH